MLKDWLTASTQGLFVLDVALTQNEVADYMRDNIASILAADAVARAERG